MNAQLESAKKTLQGMQNVAPQSGASIGSFNGKPIYAGSDASVAQQMGVTPAPAPAQNSPVVMKANEVNAPVAAPVIPPANNGNFDIQEEVARQVALKTASQSSAMTQAQTQNTEYANKLKELLGKQENKTYDLNTAMEAAGVNEITKQQNNLTGLINTKMASLTSGLTNIEGKAIPMEFITGQQAEMKRQAASEISVLQAQQSVLEGNLANAKDAAQRAVDLIYGPDEQRIKNLQTFINLNKDTMDAEEKKQATAMERALAIQATDVANKKQITTNNIALMGDYAKYAMENGQSTIASKISALNPNSPTFATEFAALQKQIVAKAGTADAPTVKTINGVDMQWNSSTGTWDPVTTTGTPSGTKSTTDQITFLEDTANKALALAGAAGRSGARRTAESWFVGSTNYSQLESLTNTLKVNVLSLMTDPNIKKFFGPQMSNADVLLMTSAGTTLNPETNSPDQMAGEIKRLQNLFERMKASVPASSGAQNIITAPNGEQVIITD
jgi:hypothetical protein